MTALEPHRMDETEIHEFMKDHGYGVLSLADESVAHGVPVSFGYHEDEGLFLCLHRFDEESTKHEFIERTSKASLTVIDTESRESWGSVVVTGTLSEFETLTPSELTEKYVAGKRMQDNAWFPSFDVSEDDDVDSTMFAFSIDDITGLKGTGG
ncbi:pyridoxamine 5'-phosphate oxidase family protein [Natrarchaeobius chitinivorans]|uniref:Pyridoxamine 5'-phosphate oxidase family protein n=1 Tax=Natrarchaeobius chitinivorans TaxID=1679083 RepID=A0A3N6PCG0_NATCH|nr:pyridoxamine 5'-phosphate oxidase family protein [Natrarchaeobius chitinivorans]RQG97149.1 hypothetical protein EA473_03480 [Natrarchaeobius chitinivorans]